MFKERAYPIPIASSSLFNKEELERAQASLTSRPMTEEDWAKYGPAHPRTRYRGPFVPGRKT
jgi:hypothetical protein